MPVKIVRIERDRHRLGLSLRQARVEAERSGWVFNDEGGIQFLPPDVAERFGVEQGEAPPPPEPAADSDAESGDAPAPAAAPPPPPAPVSAMEAALQKAGISEEELRNRTAAE